MTDPFTAIEDFRPAFEVYAAILARSYASPVDAAVDFGLQPNERAFNEIDRNRARSILRYLLRYDLAYGCDLMTEEQSRQTIDLLMERLPGDTRFYTNAEWDRRSTLGENHIASGTNWVPATDCTFDGGIIALAKNCSVCVWFGDED
jgi:hypothetical protein